MSEDPLRSKDILDQSVRDFISNTASRSPTPGGGSVAALAGALAAALAEMALQYTVGKKQFEPQRDALIDAIDKLRKSAGLMQDLIREDISAYADLSRFLKLPPEQRQSDPNYIPALVAAIRSPQAVGGLAMHILELSETLLDKCNPQLISDLGVASALAHATVHAAELNVLVNLRLLPNEEEAASLKKRTRDLSLKSDIVWHRIRERVYAAL